MGPPAGPRRAREAASEARAPERTDWVAPPTHLEETLHVAGLDHREVARARADDVRAPRRRRRRARTRVRHAGGGSDGAGATRETQSRRTFTARYEAPPRPPRARVPVLCLVHPGFLCAGWQAPFSADLHPSCRAGPATLHWFPRLLAFAVMVSWETLSSWPAILGFSFVAVLVLALVWLGRLIPKSPFTGPSGDDLKRRFRCGRADGIASPSPRGPRRLPARLTLRRTLLVPLGLPRRAGRSARMCS